MKESIKQNNLQTFHGVLYSRALHPELFQLKARRAERQGEYDLELWLMNGSHVLRFEHGEFCCCELVTDQDRNLPASGVVASYQCAGEHDIEHTFERQHVNYINSVQTEALSESLFLDAVEEYEELARENNSLVHSWMDDAGRCLSVLDVQHYKREVHIQAYHLLASGGLCVRSQTIFEIIR